MKHLRSLKKIGDIKGLFHENMGKIKDRNGMNITEAENTKKRCSRMHKRTVQKSLNDPDNHDGVVIHREPEILECEVKWALGSITTNKASGSNGISGELFKILKDDVIKVLYLICQQIWKTRNWKRSVFILIPKKSNVNKYSKYHKMFKLLYNNCTYFTFYQENAQNPSS